jgi:signal peptidase I
MAGLRDSWNRLTSGAFGYVVYAVLGILIAFIANQALAYALDTDLPVVAVVSSSMTHDSTTPQVFYQWLQDNMNYSKSYIDSWPVHDGFVIGDLPIIEGSTKYNIGDVIVYSIPDQSVPIIHRIISVNPDGSFMTKGDHNSGLLPFEHSVKLSQAHGKVIFIVPKLGYFKVIVSRIFGGT